MLSTEVEQILPALYVGYQKTFCERKIMEFEPVHTNILSPNLFSQSFNCPGSSIQKWRLFNAFYASRSPESIAYVECIQFA